MLGEVGDKLASASIDDISTKLSQSHNADSSLLRVLLAKFFNSNDAGNDEPAKQDHPSNSAADSKVDRLEEIRKVSTSSPYIGYKADQKVVRCPKRCQH